MFKSIKFIKYIKFVKLLCIIIFTSLVVLLSGCSNNNDKADGYGNFEATEIIISAETTGKIINFNINEGQVIQAGQQVALIDTVQLSLKKEQLIAMRNAVSSKFKNIVSQVDVQKQQLETYVIEKKRIESLLKDGAATLKQLDDMQGRINVTESQIKAIETQNTPVFSELDGYNKQILQLADQIKRSIIINPIDGTILEKYAEADEITVAGKALYKIADLSEMELKVYISERQLSSIKLGQKIKVKIDNAKSNMVNYDGVVSWISQQAEFTPKIIQTKEERVKLVYAVKIKVKNDGNIKIGMPGEAYFN